MIPLWVKLAYTLMAMVVVFFYYRNYPPTNFLWFSDIALIGLVPALWLENNLLFSMIAISVLIPEIFWNLSYFLRLLTGKRMGGLVNYMFDSKKPLYLRGLSLFHVLLPPLLLWCLSKLGYDSNALLLQTIFAWIVLSVCYFFVNSKENVNWVRGWADRPQTKLSPSVYFGLMMIGFPVVLYLPTHFLLLLLFH